MVLICSSLIASDVEHPFIWPIGPLYVLLGEVLFRSFAYFLIGLFVFLEWSRVSSLYILEIRPWSEVSLANIFSLFILLMISLAMKKLLSLMKFHFFILSFMSLVLGDILVKILLCRISDIFLRMFCSRTFMVL